MTQENGKETLEDFVERSVKESKDTIKSLLLRTNPNAGGLTLADAGAKISTEEGKLEILRSVAYLIQA